METRISLKNMVCNRCIMVVENEFKALGIFPTQVELGTVFLAEALTSEQFNQLSASLTALGFEVLTSASAKIVEETKRLIIEMVHHSTKSLTVNLSAYLQEQTGVEYAQLAVLFNEVQATTIEKYYLLQRIEKVKELISYQELSLSEIAFEMGYSSTAHLSNQFKKMTGQTPSMFKKSLNFIRKPLDLV